VLEHAGFHLRVQLGQRVVEQKHRRAADRSRHRARLGQTQGQGHQPLLASRAVETQVSAVHLDEEIVAMRSDDGLPAPNLLREPRLQGGHDVRRAGLGGKTATVAHGDLAGSGQRRIQGARLLLERLQGGATPPDDLEPDPRELLAPRGERAAERGAGEPALQEVIPAREDLAVATHPAQVGRVELTRESVDEAPARLRAVGEDGQVLPPEADGARPGATLASHAPGTVIAARDGATDRAHRVGTPDIAGHEGARRVPAEHVRRLGATKRAAKEQDAERFEEVRLALSVEAAQDVQVGRRREGEGSIVAKIRQFYPVNLQRFSLP